MRAPRKEPNLLLRRDHLLHDVFNWRRPIKAMRVEQVDIVRLEPLKILLTCDGHLLRISAEAKVRGLGYREGAELGSQDVLALLGVEGEPLDDDDLGVALCCT